MWTNCVARELCLSSAIIESLTLANVSWYGQKETETNSVMLNNVHFVFFNTKEFHTMAAFIKIQKRNIPMYVRLYHWCFKCLSSFIRYIVWNTHTIYVGFLSPLNLVWFANIILNAWTSSLWNPVIGVWLLNRVVCFLVWNILAGSWSFLTFTHVVSLRYCLFHFHLRLHIYMLKRMRVIKKTSD